MIYSLRPEHTLAGYRLALDLGADYIEPDLVPTKDNILVAVHSLDLNLTTDVSDKFPIERATFNISGLGPSTTSGYLVTDFTYAEIKTLRVKQGVHDTKARSRYFDGLFSIPSFQEILDLIVDWNTNVVPLITRKDEQQKNNTNTTSSSTTKQQEHYGVGTNDIPRKSRLYVELKQANFLRNHLNISIADLFIQELNQHPQSKQYFFNASECQNRKYDEYIMPPLVIQCFDTDTLSYLYNTMISDSGMNQTMPPMIKLVSLKTCMDNDFWYKTITPQTYKFIQGVGPDKNCLLQKGDLEGAGFVKQGLNKYNVVLHPWTERLETEFVSERFASAEEELLYMFCDLGIQGIFAENVDVGKRVAQMPCDLYREQEEIAQTGVDVKEENKIAELMCENQKNSDEVLMFISSFAALAIGICFGLFAQGFVKRMRHAGKLRSGNNMVNTQDDDENYNIDIDQNTQDDERIDRQII